MNYRTLTQIFRIIYGRGRVRSTNNTSHICSIRIDVQYMDALHSLAIGYLSLFRNNVPCIRILLLYLSIYVSICLSVCIWEKPLLEIFTRLYIFSSHWFTSTSISFRLQAQLNLTWLFWYTPPLVWTVGGCGWGFSVIFTHSRQTARIEEVILLDIRLVFHVLVWSWE